MRDWTKEKEWQSSGLTCVVVATSMGHRCGYVGVPKEHPAHGFDYDIDTLNDIHVHGGLTFASAVDKGYPCANPDGLWFFGYDCAHIGDKRDPSLLSDEMRQAYSYGFEEPGSTIKDLNYCINECESLARQLDALK